MNQVNDLTWMAIQFEKAEREVDVPEFLQWLLTVHLGEEGLIGDPHRRARISPIEATDADSEEQLPEEELEQLLEKYDEYKKQYYDLKNAYESETS